MLSGDGLNKLHLISVFPIEFPIGSFLPILYCTIFRLVFLYRLRSEAEGVEGGKTAICFTVQIFYSHWEFNTFLLSITLIQITSCGLAYMYICATLCNFWGNPKEKQLYRMLDCANAINQMISIKSPIAFPCSFYL